MAFTVKGKESAPLPHRRPSLWIALTSLSKAARSALQQEDCKSLFKIRQYVAVVLMSKKMQCDKYNFDVNIDERPKECNPSNF